MHKLGRRCCDSNLERHDPEISIIRHSLWRAGSSRSRRSSRSRVVSDKGPIWHQQQQQQTYNHPLPSAYLSPAQSLSPAFHQSFSPVCRSFTFFKEVNECNFTLVPYSLHSTHSHISLLLCVGERMRRGFASFSFVIILSLMSPFYYFNVRFNV